MYVRNVPTHACTHMPTRIYSYKYKLGRDSLCFNFSSQIHAIKYLQTDIELNQGPYTKIGIYAPVQIF